MKQTNQSRETDRNRAQGTLLSVLIATVLLFALTGWVVFSLGASPSVGPATGQYRAMACADAIVSESANWTVGANVLDRSVIQQHEDSLPSVCLRGAVRIRLGNSTIIQRGTLTDSATVRRLVLAGTARTTTTQVQNSTQLPPDTDRVIIAGRIRSLQMDGRLIFERSDARYRRITVRRALDRRSKMTVTGSGPVTVHRRHITPRPVVLEVTISDGG